MPKNQFAPVQLNGRQQHRKNRVHVIIFAGMRGSGKDEKTAKLHQLFSERDVWWANVGEILSEEVESGSELGKKIDSYKEWRNKGGLLPGDLAYYAVDKWIRKQQSGHTNVRIVIVAGGSRSTEENTLWRDNYRKVDVVYTEVEEHHVNESIKRRQAKSGKVRPDEKPSAVKLAWREFRKKTEPGLKVWNGELTTIKRTDRMRHRFETFITRLSLAPAEKRLLLGRLSDPKHPVSVDISRIDAIDHPSSN